MILSDNMWLISWTFGHERLNILDRQICASCTDELLIATPANQCIYLQLIVDMLLLVRVIPASRDTTWLVLCDPTVKKMLYLISVLSVVYSLNIYDKVCGSTCCDIDTLLHFPQSKPLLLASPGRPSLSALEYDAASLGALCALVILSCVILCETE